LHNGLLGDLVPSRRRVRDFFDNIGFQQEIDILTHRLPSDTSVIRKLCLSEMCSPRRDDRPKAITSACRVETRTVEGNIDKVRSILFENDDMTSQSDLES